MDEALLSRILGALEGIIAFDGAGKLLYANALAAETLGYSSSEVLKAASLNSLLDFTDVFDMQGQAMSLNTLFLSPTLAEGSEAEAVVRLHIKATGVDHWSRVKSRPVHDSSGQVECVVSTFYDATEAINAERARVAIAIDNAKLYAEVYEQREQLDVTLNSIGDAVITTDAASHVTFMNPVAEVLTGWTTDDAVGQSIEAVFRVIHETTREPVSSPTVDALRQGRIISLDPDTLLLRKSGGEIAISDSGAPIRDATGRIFGAILVFRDVTGQRQNEEALRKAKAEAEESAETRRIALEAGHMGTWTLDLIQNTSRRSVEHDQIFGYHDPLLTWDYQDFLSHVVPDDRAAADAGFAAARQTGNLDVECRIRRPDGETRWILVLGRVFYDREKQPERMAGIVMDISERKSTEATLHEAREHLRMTIESVRDYAIFSLSIDSHVTMWNSGAEHIFGYSEAEALGQPGSFIFTPEDRAVGAVELELNQALTQGYAEDERWHLRKDQSRFFASGIMSPLRDADGQVQGFVKVARDITERRLMEEERAELLRLEQAARIEAERTNALKLRFLGMISHELRTPLTSIKGFTTTLLASDVVWMPEQQTQFVEIIDQEADKLKDLVEQLLDVSSLQAGTLRIHPECIMISGIIDAAWTQMRAVSANHRLKLDVPDTLPPVLADIRRIGQVLTNLVQNAAKYSPDGRLITLQARETDGSIQIEITDEGVGILPEDRENVFDAFHRIERHTRQGGAGLGLAICKGVVEAHGGRIWIVDRDAPGTTIAFTLPSGCDESASDPDYMPH